MKGFAAFVLAAVLAAGPTAAPAHPGGVNAEGCHTNRKTGDYHCHGARTAPLRAAPRTKPHSARKPSDQHRPLASPLPARAFAYPSCAAARAAGAGPMRRGDPGYGPHLDRDNDGVACEWNP